MVPSDAVIRAQALCRDRALGVQVVAGDVREEAANVVAILADGRRVEGRTLNVGNLPVNAFVAAVSGDSPITEVVAFNSEGKRLGADDHLFRYR